MKTCVSSYSFQRMLLAGECTQLSLIRIAKDMGFAAIEFTELNPPASMRAADYASLLREESEKQGIPIVNYTIGAELIGKDTAAEVERLLQALEIAHILGARGMRHDATRGYTGADARYKGFAQALPQLAKVCRQITEYAAGYHIYTMVENHGFFCQESGRLEELICTVAHPNFGLLVDIGNFACVDEAAPFAVGRLAPFARHVHVKDFHIKDGNGFAPGDGFFKSRGGQYLRGAILGHGDIPVLPCVRALQQAGYDGYVSIEFEGLEHPQDALPIAYENLCRILNTIAFAE